MKRKISAILFLSFTSSVFLNAQSIELGFNATPFNFDKNHRSYSMYSNNNIGSFDDKSTSTYFNFSPEISFIQKNKNQTNLRLSFGSSSYTWNTYYSQENYTLSKSQRYFAGFEIGRAKRISMNRILLMPEVLVGFSTSVYQQYRGSNVSNVPGSEHLVTYDVTSPSRFVVFAGFQQSVYYRLHSRIHLGMQLRIAGNLNMLRGEEHYIREDVYDNLFGDEIKITKVKNTTISQNSSMGISFRYRIK